MNYEVKSDRVVENMRFVEIPIKIKITIKIKIKIKIKNNPQSTTYNPLRGRLFPIRAESG